MAGRTAASAIPLERVEAVVEGIIDLALDEAAANPEPGRAVEKGAGIEAAGNPVGFEAGFPGLPSVGDDEFLFDDEPLDGEFLFEAGVFLFESHDALAELFDFGADGIDFDLTEHGAGKKGSEEKAVLFHARILQEQGRRGKREEASKGPRRRERSC